MFKLIAILGVVAGGAGYGLYAGTGLFGTQGPSNPGPTRAGCPNTAKVTAPCCATPCPDCSTGTCVDCCEVCDLCCGPVVK